MDGVTPADLAPRPPVEVTVTDRCDHLCFAVWVSSEAVWRLPGMEDQHTPPEKGGVFHAHDDDVECDGVCRGIWD